MATKQRNEEMHTLTSRRKECESEIKHCEQEVGKHARQEGEIEVRVKEARSRLEESKSASLQVNSKNKVTHGVMSSFECH